MFQLFDLLSDMGGQVGLWLGLSILTVFEILELITDLGVICAKKSRRPQNARDAWGWAASESVRAAAARAQTKRAPAAADGALEVPLEGGEAKNIKVTFKGVNKVSNLSTDIDYM